MRRELLLQGGFDVGEGEIGHQRILSEDHDRLGEPAELGHDVAHVEGGANVEAHSDFTREPIYDYPLELEGCASILDRSKDAGTEFEGLVGYSMASNMRFTPTVVNPVAVTASPIFTPYGIRSCAMGKEGTRR